eukprot:PLAT15973.1.p1 GENE.PLAT15973.1~~PLAT15973.1.p1  ORF type:complete len:315 (+),score=143.29 PLAT15973.1:27-971(+)
MAEAARTVLVTGASGFMASYIVKMLLEAGHVVHGTVRNAAKESSVAHLKALDGAEERLKLFSADIVVDDCFDLAAQGCDVVIHTASPVIVPGTEELVDTSCKGVRNAFSASVKAGTVKQFIHTSSGAAVTGGSSDPEHVFTEEDWSDAEDQRSREAWYALSKTASEQLVYELEGTLTDENRFIVSTICPCLSFGKPLQEKKNFSVNVLRGLLSGERSISNGCMSIIDVRDAAAAHVLIMDKASPGRHLAYGPSLHWADMADRLRELRPDAPVQEYTHDSPRDTPSKVSTDKLKALGMEFHDVLADTLAWSIEGM